MSKQPFRPRATTSLTLTLALLVAGCGGTEPSPDANTATPANTIASTPAPVSPPPTEATPTPTGPAPLTAQGWGPLRIGMTVAQITAALGPDADPQAVGGPDPAQCDQYRPARAPEGLLVMVEDGRLVRISLIRAAAIETDRGLALGATAAAVRAAYGPALVATPHEYQDAPAEYLTAWEPARAAGASGQEVTDPTARGIRYEIGSDGNVTTIHAGGPSVQYVEGCV